MRKSASRRARFCTTCSARPARPDPEAQLFQQGFAHHLLPGLVGMDAVQAVILLQAAVLQQRAAQIRSQCQFIAERIAVSGYLNGSSLESIDPEIRQLGTLFSGRVVIVNSSFRIVRDTYDADTDKILIAKEIVNAFRDDFTGSYGKNGTFLEVTVPIRDSRSQRMQGIMILSAPTTDIEEGKKALNRTVYILEIVLILVVLVVAYYAARSLVRPFGKVTAMMEENGGFLDEDISIPDYTETENLAEAYNRMRRRMKEQEDSRQEFVSNVSHELKTPLTSMKVLSDSLIAQDEVPNELYKEFMTDIAEEIDRENKIINDLLSLVKMDRKSSDVNIKETNINDLIDLILKRLRPIASTRGIELVLEDYKPILAEVDETKLTLALSNLVENAIKYNHDDGWVHVSLNNDGTFFFVKVEDSGLGIPEESQPFIFERFYRVDKSHSREIGGTGLGLAITKRAVEMHHGAIRVYSKVGEGTTFTVRIPIRYTTTEDSNENEKE